MRLVERVREIQGKLDTRETPCKRVILVTHSMGGLVARAACKFENFETDVLGIIHTVQPVTGAPAAYWRMKAGFERKDPWRIRTNVTARTLGTDGLEVTSLLARMPGGLQLLPSHAYRTNDGHPGWLRFVGADGKEHRLPQKGDPYQEIYREEKAEWRLIRWKEYIVARRPGQSTQEEIEAGWLDFIAQLRIADTFHRKLGDYKHPLSHHIYGTGSSTVDVLDLKIQKRIRRTWNPFAEGGGYEGHSDERGRFRVFFGDEEKGAVATQQLCIEMGPPEGDGDSTVARASGSHLVTGTGSGTRFVLCGLDYEQTGTVVEEAEHDAVFKNSKKARKTCIEAIKALCRYRIRQECRQQSF